MVSNRLFLFPSRNRGSFDFKSDRFHQTSMLYRSFNLAIEVLLISRAIIAVGGELLSMFQSRNRGSFGFKVNFDIVFSAAVTGLFQSRNRGSFGFKYCSELNQQHVYIAFQSRNRDSFNFKKPNSR